MTNSANSERIDEISVHYLPPRRVALILRRLLWLGALLSIATFFSSSLESWLKLPIAIGFPIVAIARYVLAKLQKHYFMARALRARRRALLTDALGSRFSPKHTHLYYNNRFSPSIRRLGANVMESSLFSAAISGRMLRRTRLEVGGYASVWMLACLTRHNDPTLIAGITQALFAIQIISGWLNLETLHNQFEQCYERLHAYFQSPLTSGPTEPTASVMEAVISYEAAKSMAGIVLCDDTFLEINPKLSAAWETIRDDLRMDVASEELAE